MNRVLEIIEECAKAANITLTQLGPSMGKNRAYYSNLKNKDSIPRTDTLVKLLALCGYSLYAVPFDEDMPDSALQIAITNDQINAKKMREIELMSRKEKLMQEIKKIDEELGD